MTKIPFDILREMLRDDFVAFLQKCFQTLHPNEKFLRNWHAVSPLQAAAHIFDMIYKGMQVILRDGPVLFMTPPSI